MESAVNGSASSNATNIARIFGTKTSVGSWIWVSAWNSDTTTPTTRPATISGEDTTTMVQIASRATSRVSGPVISKFPSTIGLQTPPSLRGAKRRSNPAFFGAAKKAGLLRCARNDGANRPPASDRHPHDVFIGLDDAVAHRHQRRDRDVGLRHRRHHVHHVGLAGSHRHALGVGLLAGVQHTADRVLQQRAERRAAGLGALR